MKIFAILALAVLPLTGCASGDPGGVPPSLTDALAKLDARVTVDLDAALAIANTPPVDEIAAQCYPVLKDFLVNTLGTSKPTIGQIQGVFSTFETARKLRMQAEGAAVGGSKIPVKLRMACAALVQDERDFAVRLAIMVGGAASGAPGVGSALGGIGGALPGVLNALPKLP